MCGILGWLGEDGASPPWEPVAKELSKLAHRGPDEQGLTGYLEDGQERAFGAACRLLLGHRRLRILDLSSAGRQPMRCPITGNVMVFNGEIYNFLELRAELESRGSTFVTGTDSEVILEVYRQSGVDAFHRFNGMWAIALFDVARRELVLSRDRLGVKPLYWARGRSGWVFGSEIGPVRRAAGLGIEVQEDLLFDYLATGRTDHTPGTLHHGVNQVPSATACRLSLSGEIRPFKYHDWPTERLSQKDQAERLNQLLGDSVRIRLRSDAPTVSLLSGGLDSSILTWLAATHKGDSRTNFAGAFTYGYLSATHRAHDEVDRAAWFIEQVPGGLKHWIHRVNAEPSSGELLDLIQVLEEPPSTPSVLAGRRLYRAVAEHGFRVVLSGEGADELFAGYVNSYLALQIREDLRKGQVLRAVEHARGLSSPWRWTLNRLAWDLPAGLALSLFRKNRPNARCIAPEFWRRMGAYKQEVLMDKRLGVADRLREDVLRTNLPMILRYADRNGMASSVEVRSPFLDYRLVGLALQLPLSELLGAGGGKGLLRKAFRGSVPSQVLDRGKSHGFGNAEQFLVPKMVDEDWLRDPSPLVRRFLDLEHLRELVKRGVDHPTLWYPIATLLWLRGLEREGT